MGDGSAVAVNIIAKGEKGDTYLQYIHDTYADVFKHVYLFPVEGNTTAVQNFILIATDKDDPAFEAERINQTYDMPSLGKVITDGRNPTELLSASLYR